MRSHCVRACDHAYSALGKTAEGKRGQGTSKGGARRASEVGNTVEGEVGLSLLIRGVGDAKEGQHAHRQQERRVTASCHPQEHSKSTGTGIRVRTASREKIPRILNRRTKKRRETGGSHAKAEDVAAEIARRTAADGKKG